MDVQMVIFPQTRVAMLEHRGDPAREHDSVRKLVAWKLENRLLDPQKHRTYGVHFTHPETVAPEDHRVLFCLSYEGEVEPNPYGIQSFVLPELRCARARDIGSRLNNKAVVYLFQEWLPHSGESLGDFPPLFHYVNVGPQVKPEEMITDVYLPLK